MLLIPSAIISGDGFVKALYPLLFLLGLIAHTRRFFWITLPFFILSPAVIYYEIVYDSPTDITLWFTLLGSSQSEASAYLSSINIALSTTLLLAYACMLVVFIRFIPNQKIKLPIWLRILFLCLVFIPIARYIKTEGDSQQKFLNVYRHYKQSYPLNILFGYQAAHLEVNRVKQFIANQDKIQCSIQSSNTAAPATTTVVVIGESARRDRLSLYGYQTNNTTPRLNQRRDDLWVFDNMVSGAFITSRSVPALLTGRVEDNDHLYPSFINAMNAAGYKTYWFSAQAKFGEFDSLVSAYASAAQQHKFLNQHSYSTSLHDFYDEELLPDLDQALAENKDQNKLIVLHFYGSHADFRRRYPKQFDIFKDPYDNSIAYTDYLLDQVIQKLEKQGGLSNMLYVSDHGLNLGQCQDNPSGHLDMKSNYDVPFIMWASPAWKKQNPTWSQQLKQAEQQALSAENIFPTLLDSAEIHCQNQSNQLSILNPQRPQHARKVLTLMQTVDYDQATDDDECHLVPHTK
ncbi:hypothetical protein BFG52_03230 [Acinetobacter larvae]|uniref:Sulfatase N-terminal domain-containing protein n=1 Tax=Acinetobacter larvae TaxID=1789224 RepID=A0A1B2M3T1_9GAMM|nr:hypothetical protein BFG52_03230 [Acinetobacter larvae]